MRTIFKFVAKLLGYKDGQSRIFLSSASTDKPKENERLSGSSSLLPQEGFSKVQHETLVSGDLSAAAPASDERLRSREETLAAIARLELVPALRFTSENLRQLLTRPGVCLEEIVAAISRDAFLSLSVLRAANGLVPAARGCVEDIATAIQILGVRRLEQVSDAHMGFHKAVKGQSELEDLRLWTHSLAVGRLSQKLAELLNVRPPLRLYFAGLWHDAGKRVLAHLYPDSYHKVVASASIEGVCLEAIEKHHFGVTHSEAGRIYADQCGVGPLVLQPIACHANPENAQFERAGTALVSIANHLAKAEGIGCGGAAKVGTGGEDSSLMELSAWTVLTAETGRKHDVPSIYQSLKPFLESLASDLETIHNSL